MVTNADVRVLPAADVSPLIVAMVTSADVRAADVPPLFPWLLALMYVCYQRLMYLPCFHGY